MCSARQRVQLLPAPYAHPPISFNAIPVTKRGIPFRIEVATFVNRSEAPKCTQGAHAEARKAPTTHPRYTTTTNTHARDLYRNAVDDAEIDTFLEETDLYDSSVQKWRTPKDPKTTGELLPSMFDILSSIVRRFARCTEPGVEREVINTNDVVECAKENAQGYRTCPVLIVRAAGPSFEFPRSGNMVADAQATAETLGFSKLATYFTLKKEVEFGNVGENLKEMGSYARHIFRDQPNRFYVRSLVLTEKYARLVHFDRAGAEITPPIGINHDPVTLIRMVAGLSSTNERALGIDDSLQWSIVDGRKGSGTLTTTAANGDSVTYPIVEEIHEPRAAICGRATTCWKVQDIETSEEYIVKDSWRRDDHSVEHELLELVKGVPGVAHIVSYETGRGETKDFRCPSTIGQYANRVASRIVLRMYGKSIESFTSILQLLCAVRDAIAGHQRLGANDVRILHRDISHNNILLGRDGAPEGRRGVLIDLDISFRATDAKPTVPVDHNIGTRPFQSIAVLRAAHREENPPHDYLDDLESFFYLLAYLFLSFRPDGGHVSSGEGLSSIVRQWGADDAAVSLGSKHRFLAFGREALDALEVVEETWGSACVGLMEAFGSWIGNLGDEKNILWRRPHQTKRKANPFESLHTHRDRHYAELLKMFDDAIAEVAIAPSSECPSDHFPKSPVALPHIHDANAFLKAMSRSLSPRASPLGTPLASAKLLPAVDFSLTTSYLPAASIPPRRSARIRDLLSKSMQSPTRPGPPLQQTKAVRTAPPGQSTQPRRSARVQKCRREGDGYTQLPSPRLAVRQALAFSFSSSRACPFLPDLLVSFFPPRNTHITTPFPYLMGSVHSSCSWFPRNPSPPASIPYYGSNLYSEPT